MKLKSETLCFSDVVGTFDVMKELIIIPETSMFSNLKNINEAKIKLIVLANTLYKDKFLITVGKIKNNRYLLFYSYIEKSFKHRRIYKSGINDLTSYGYNNLSMVIFYADELKLLNNKNCRARKYLDRTDNNVSEMQKIIIVIGSNRIKDRYNYYSMCLNNIFKNTEAILYIDKDTFHVDKKDGSFLLC